ncbi:MAG: hypothetical protein JO335_06115 [Sphingomonas sp.]|nr:hypothetical protein [Sphingomonas sp.]
MAAAAQPVGGKTELAPAQVPELVAAALNCFESIEASQVNMSRLRSAGWVERLDKNGQPETAGGHAFQRSGLTAEIAVVGRVCSLVAPVKSFDDVQATLMKLDDAIHPDGIREVKEGILLTKDHRSVLFWVGNPTTRSPAAVRIDASFMETK